MSNYFTFNTLKKFRTFLMYLNCRSTKNGFWKASTGETEIKDGGNNVIGTTRSLVFYYYAEHPHEKKTNWIMHEYKLNEHQSVNHVQIPIDPMKVYKHYTIPSLYNNSL